MKQLLHEQSPFASSNFFENFFSDISFTVASTQQKRCRFATLRWLPAHTNVPFAIKVENQWTIFLFIAHLHLLFWYHFFHTFQMQTSFPRLIDNFIKEHLSRPLKTKRNILLSNAVGSLLWNLWLRNNRLFSKASRSPAYPSVGRHHYHCLHLVNQVQSFCNYSLATISLN